MHTSKVENQVLLYIIKDDKVLLINKKRGLGAGLVNGVGGKVEAQEDVIDAVKRECKEEVGVLPRNIQKRGVLYFNNNDKEHILVHVFVAGDYEGELKETEEAEPFWVKTDEIPYDKMWEDDVFWLPYVIKGYFVYGEFNFKDWKLHSHKVYLSSEKLSEVLRYAEDNSEYCPFFKETDVKKYLEGIKEEIDEIIKAKNIEEFKEEIGDVLHDVLGFMWKLHKESVIRLSEISDLMLNKMRRRKPHVFEKRKVNLKDAVDHWFKVKRETNGSYDIEQKLRDETKKWLFKLEGLKFKPISKDGEDIMRNIDAYIKDAKYFLDNNMLIEAFEAVIWAWAWFEIGTRMNIISS